MKSASGGRSGVAEGGNVGLNGSVQVGTGVRAGGVMRAKGVACTIVWASAGGFVVQPARLAAIVKRIKRRDIECKRNPPECEAVWMPPRPAGAPVAQSVLPLGANVNLRKTCRQGHCKVRLSPEGAKPPVRLGARRFAPLSVTAKNAPSQSVNGLCTGPGLTERRSRGAELHFSKAQPKRPVT